MLLALERHDDHPLSRRAPGRARSNHYRPTLSDARHGRELCRLGAVPAVLTMFETPLVAYRSVDRLMRSGAKFAHCIGPQAIFERTSALRQSRHWQLTFPSYWRNQLPTPIP